MRGSNQRTFRKFGDFVFVWSYIYYMKPHVLTLIPMRVILFVADMSSNAIARLHILLLGRCGCWRGLFCWWDVCDVDSHADFDVVLLVTSLYVPCGFCSEFYRRL